jgi:hypothetical protein
VGIVPRRDGRASGGRRETEDVNVRGERRLRRLVSARCAS